MDVDKVNHLVKFKEYIKKNSSNSKGNEDNLYIYTDKNNKKKPVKVLSKTNAILSPGLDKIFGTSDDKKGDELEKDYVSVVGVDPKNPDKTDKNAFAAPKQKLKTFEQFKNKKSY